MISSETINKSNLNLHCGKIENYKRNAYGISGKTENAYFRISVVQKGIFKIHLSRFEEFDEYSYAVISKPVGIDFSIIDANGHIELKTEALTLEIKKNPFTAIFKDNDGKIINEDDHALGTSWLGEQLSLLNFIPFWMILLVIVAIGFLQDRLFVFLDKRLFKRSILVE